MASDMHAVAVSDMRVVSVNAYIPGPANTLASVAIAQSLQPLVHNQTGSFVSFA